MSAITLLLSDEKTSLMETSFFEEEESVQSHGSHLFSSDTASVTSEYDLQTLIADEALWCDLDHSLRPLARFLVYTSPLPSWRGQEDDVIADIAQEAMRRVIERAQKAWNGEASPIQSLQKIATTIACNYYRDLKRRDRRLLRQELLEADGRSPHMCMADKYSSENLLDTIADKIDEETLFQKAAALISHFPLKQRKAILTDLANRMSFDNEPTVLQEAFLDAGIELHQYRQPLPLDPKERSRQISLSSQAYKRVGKLACAQ